MRRFVAAGFLITLFCAVAEAQTNWSIARIWDEEILRAIRIDIPNPPVHARNLFHFSAAMYDAWAAYDANAVGFVYRAKAAAMGDVAAARREAISYAAYGILKERYALSFNASNTLAALDVRLVSLGYSTNNLSKDPAIPAGVGNLVAAAISAWAIEDGARQLQRYADFTPEEGGYQSVNLPLVTRQKGNISADVNRWQRLAITDAATQNDIPVDSIQKFLGAHWRDCRPFALRRDNPALPWIDPGPPPKLTEQDGTEFRAQVVEVLRMSSQLSPLDGAILDISPGARGNNSLGANDGKGFSLNPATGQPYAQNLVNRADFARVLAEFWADGPNSETPPGHWNTIANSVVDHPLFPRRFGGTGPVLEPLEWDVKMYFAVNAAVHDAGCAAWTLKRFYDGWRPMSAIRYLAARGQSSNPDGYRYTPLGIPLVSNLIEMVTVDSARIGGRHEGIQVGAMAVRSWPGQPLDPTNSFSGVKWIEGIAWMPYQRASFVTPSFPGYISGHSTFSWAAAEVLTAMTGTPFFPGGLGGFTAKAQVFLSFEKGPNKDVPLQWATYYDAADQAGLSRLYGGIHVSADDLTGRRIGAKCGKQSWALARRYFDGTILPETGNARVVFAGEGVAGVRFDATRGFYYRLQGTPDLSIPFVYLSPGQVQALDGRLTLTNAVSGSQMFFRVVGAVKP